MQSSPCAFVSIRKSWCSKAHTVRYSTGFTEWTDTSALPLATCSWSAPQREEHRQFTRGGGEGEGGAVPHAQCRLLCAFCWRPARSLSLQRDRVRSKSPSYSLKPLDRSLARSLANGCTSESVCYWLWKLVSQVTVSLLRAVVLPAAQVQERGVIASFVFSLVMDCPFYSYYRLLGFILMLCEIASCQEYGNLTVQNILTMNFPVACLYRDKIF